MKITKSQAIYSLYPESKVFEIAADGTVTFRFSDDKNPTDAQIDAEVTRLQNAEGARLLRVERDKRLAASDWRASSDLTLSDAWKTYRQQLRDLPASTTPVLNSEYELALGSVTWPEEPKS